mmetsp:Transcript_17314/g.55541  ORF Transcript_17314/g.55541 Transcript_17314/m.55541 type:complete len:84 (-) Transcript_17314:2533-2784(-)
MSARSFDEVADLAAEELELELEDFEEEVEEGCAGSPNATAGGNAHCPMGSPYAVVSKLDKAHEVRAARGPLRSLLMGPAAARR